MTVAYHIALGVLVVFDEGDADRHVEEMPDCDPPAPEHDECAGPGGAQSLFHRCWMAVMAGEADRSDLFQRHFEARRMARGRNVRGRHQPADVTETPGVERGPAPV